MTVTVFGIRHHGPGCARSLRHALARLQPDLVLVEGPPDADEEIAAAGLAGMTPPVALLVHDLEQPSRASFYPFAVFSPEWQAIQWALSAKVPVRFCDLPATHRFALQKVPTTSPAPEAEPPTDQAVESPSDPFDWFARADGYSDGERWWNDKVEERGSDLHLFAAILEAVTALRDELALPESELEQRREAWMRRTVAAAQKEASNIAVVCGAWHAPRILTAIDKKADKSLLEHLPKTKVRATWTPWTHQRLTLSSGYGAGVQSPGWYEHLWHGGDHVMLRWLVRGARELRKQDAEASSASVIEAARLAEALAGLRGRAQPGYAEAMAAMTSVFCSGDSTSLQLLRKPLLVGEQMGQLPEGLARLPLQADIEAQQRSLRLQPKASAVALELDLREPGGQQRSVFLHRLQALRIRWGEKERASGKGTFKERWQLRWQPELQLAIVDAAMFGNTVESAAAACLLHEAANDDLGAVVERLELALLADLPAATRALLHWLDAAAARGDEPRRLLAAIPPLARLARYGSVRATDTAAVHSILARFAARLHAELPPAAAGIDDDNAASLATQLRNHDAALALLDAPELRAEWQAVAHTLADHERVHPQIRGLCVRLLHDATAFAADVVRKRLEFAASGGQEHAHVAAWIEGFFAGSGAILVHDPQLTTLLRSWVASLAAEAFTATLPLLRRTFATFTPTERRKIGEVLAAGGTGIAPTSATFAIDADRARPAIATVARLLGLPGGSA